jgi:hypothetical protein
MTILRGGNFKRVESSGIGLGALIKGLEGV